MDDRTEFVPKGESLWLIEQTSTVDGIRRFWTGVGYGWDVFKAARYPSKEKAEEVARNRLNCTVSTVHGYPEICEHLFQCGPALIKEQSARIAELEKVLRQVQGGTWSMTAIDAALERNILKDGKP